MDYKPDCKPSRAWVEVNLDNIAHNVREIKRIVREKCEIMGVVKADAYGHGVTGVAGTLLCNGATRLAVSMPDEAIQLRNSGINAPVLVLNHMDPQRAEEIIANDITQTVFSFDVAGMLSDAAVKLGKKAKIHIKIDTGMTRVGFIPGRDTLKNIAKIARLPGVETEGIFTHFASADESDKSYTYRQFERFMDVCSELKKLGVDIPIKHTANSAAIIGFPETHLDMVRPGIIIYGLYPSRETDTTMIDLKPAMEFKTKVVLVKEVGKGIPVSYGRKFTTGRTSRIATIPVGYADGFSRLLGNKGRALVNGEYAPVIGTVCMDQCMLDVTDMKNEAGAGDEVVLFGSQSGNDIKVEEVASSIGTINYEVVCGINKRIPRVYLQDGKVSGVLNYLI